jgi:hypothetical protein
MAKNANKSVNRPKKYGEKVVVKEDFLGIIGAIGKNAKKKSIKKNER